MGCQPFLDESLLAGATRLRPRWRELGSLCAAGQFQRAAELDAWEQVQKDLCGSKTPILGQQSQQAKLRSKTERWVAALAQLGHDVPPDFLLSFQELCNLLGRLFQLCENLIEDPPSEAEKEIDFSHKGDLDRENCCSEDFGDSTLNRKQT
eukprot:g2698.t1